jgi:peptidoglycan/xylan/chitin deacetylase (PgdA/CDA1 family)
MVTGRNKDRSFASFFIDPSLFPGLQSAMIFHGGRHLRFEHTFRFWVVVVVIFLSLPISAVSDPKIDLIIEHGRRDSRKIALTFDACPTGRAAEYDEKVIEILVQEKVPATLFLSGRWVEKNIEKTKYLASQPIFEIANHGFWHPHMLEKDDERIMRELKRTQTIIKKVTGKESRYFRPPYGEVDERVAMLVQKAGLVTIQYDLPSGDPDANLSAARIARDVLRDARGGSIIVFHMNGNGVHTAEALPGIISGLRKKGFTLVTVGELLRE